MKVLCVIDALGRGGAEQSLSELAEPLRSRGIELSIACRTRRDGHEDRLRAAGFEIFRLTGGTTLSRAAQLRRLVRAQQPDLVHATLVTSTLTARLALTGTQVPVLTSLVNTTYTPPARLGRPGLRRTVIRAVDGWTARHLNSALHALSAAVADDAAANLRVEREAITVIGRGRSRTRLGSPSTERREHARSTWGIGPDDELVVTVGRQEHQKGHITLLEAWTSIAAQRPHARLVLAGRQGLATPELDAVIAAMPPAARGRVERPGHVDDIGELLAAADLFAFPSRHEGLAGAMVEALAMGLPVVASDLPVFREYLTPDVNAVLVPFDDTHAWVTAVVDLLGDRDRRAQMATANIARFDERFELDSIADAMSALYREVVTAGRSRARRRSGSAA